jgi:hypothetical protein
MNRCWAPGLSHEGPLMQRLLCYKGAGICKVQLRKLNLPLGV